jgi:hypothetical protein
MVFHRLGSWLAAGYAITALIALQCGSASAASAGTHSVDGMCSLSGRIRFLRPFSGRVSGTRVVEAILQGDQSSTAACVAGTLTSIGYRLSGRTITPVVG